MTDVLAVPRYRHEEIVHSVDEKVKAIRQRTETMARFTDRLQRLADELVVLEHQRKKR